MLPKKARRNKRTKKILLLFFGFCILFLIAIVFLIYSVFFVKKESFISPVATSNNNEEKKIEKLLHDAEIPFSSISLFDYYYIVTLLDGGEARLQMPEHSSGGQVIISLKKDIEKQITSLQPILKQLTIDGRKFNRIDFRYDKPLVVYE